MGYLRFRVLRETPLTEECPRHVLAPRRPVQVESASLQLSTCRACAPVLTPGLFLLDGAVVGLLAGGGEGRGGGV